MKRTRAASSTSPGKKSARTAERSSPNQGSPAAKSATKNTPAEQKMGSPAPEQLQFDGTGYGPDGPDWAALSAQFPAHVIAVMKRRWEKREPVVMYSDGIYDLFHAGHARALEQAKRALPWTKLKVGCCSDALTHRLKGQTVLTDVERYESLRHCRWVDVVVKDAPWVLSDEFLAEHDIDFVCHDALPYSDASGDASSGDVYAHLKARGMFWETQRTEGVSTTGLIVRIVQRYDDFVRRNMARGLTAEEMNVPLSKELSLQVDMAMKDAVKATKHALKDTQASVQSVVRRWSERADEIQTEFLQLFKPGMYGVSMVCVGMEL